MHRPDHSHRRIESAVESGAGAVWQRARFGTVRPRVQIPGPRPFSYSKSSIAAVFEVVGFTAGSQLRGNSEPEDLKRPPSSADLNSRGWDGWRCRGSTP